MRSARDSLRHRRYEPNYRSAAPAEAGAYMYCRRRWKKVTSRPAWSARLSTPQVPPKTSEDPFKAKLNLTGGECSADISKCGQRTVVRRRIVEVGVVEGVEHFNAELHWLALSRVEGFHERNVFSPQRRSDK